MTTSPIRVTQVDTRIRGQVAQFVNVPFELYRNCAQWAPPLVSSVKLALDRKRHPFYRHSDAAFFLAERDGIPVGRIGVLDNRRYNDHNHSKVAFFYYFDLVDDIAVAARLVEAAAGWARARGLTTLMGPKGLLRADAYGVLVEGFQHFAGMGLPYTYPYYARLLEELGFVKEIDYLTGHLTPEDRIPDRLFRMVERIKTRSGFEVKSFASKRELRRWIPRIQHINNAAFTEVWGYYPIDRAEVEMIADQLLSVADPHLMKVVLLGEEVVGFAFVFPDLGMALKATQGRLWPFGWIRILSAIKRTRSLQGNGVGLLPEYQGLGGSAMLYAELHDTIRARGADYFELVQVMETNTKSLGDMNMLGIHWHKRHRVYRLDLGSTD
jgi:GNAT superfamily N-acetyltransferase